MKKHTLLLLATIAGLLIAAFAFWLPLSVMQFTRNVLFGEKSRFIIPNLLFTEHIYWLISLLLVTSCTGLWFSRRWAWSVYTGVMSFAMLFVCIKSFIMMLISTNTPGEGFNTFMFMLGVALYLPTAILINTRWRKEFNILRVDMITAIGIVIILLMDTLLVAWLDLPVY